ncbi:hypothetical protein CONLIGDRAFT_637287 [Coniochaeta ligniaria NRRL 30616]|uniref:Uncharacterized protein n=1 Tax=Coniochaeta ligniaria NRRL 30616 TaxID=1408157 RepID=A0A1J7J4E7_9PEZI|nr:hypothetical protein CONLIGDRAFT_637287 [Coniochaeta ligniaria NRRL 30616]
MIWRTRLALASTMLAVEPHKEKSDRQIRKWDRASHPQVPAQLNLHCGDSNAFPFRVLRVSLSGRHMDCTAACP